MAVITFSREAHSGTQDLARLLAQRLGYRYVSRDELTQAAAARSGLTREPTTPETEGRPLSFFEQLGEQLTGDREAYRAGLKAVVTELALADNVVLVGHGAGQFLRDVPAVLRVFIVAPIEDRVARVMAEGEADADRARRLVDEQDRQSAAYLRYLFGIDWLDPHQWDLVINVGRTNVNAALDMLLDYARSLVRAEAEHDALLRLDDAARVEQALSTEPDLGVAELNVRSESSSLVLEGEALAQEDRARAEEIARAVAPDDSIDNRIVVHPPSSA
jgi:cytidylate kinase